MPHPRGGSNRSSEFLDAVCHGRTMPQHCKIFRGGFPASKALSGAGLEFCPYRVQKFPGWLILRRGSESNSHMLDGSCRGNLTEVRQHAVLHAAPQRTAAQKQAIQLEYPFVVAENHRADQAVIAEPVTNPNHHAFRAF